MYLCSTRRNKYIQTKLENSLITSSSFSSSSHILPFISYSTSNLTSSSSVSFLSPYLPPHTPPFYKIVSEAKIQPHSTPAEGVALVGWPSGLAPGRRCVPGVPMSPPSVPLACPPPLSVPLHIRGCSSLSTPRRLLQFS